MKVFFLAERPNLPNLFGVLVNAGVFLFVAAVDGANLTRPEDRSKPDDTNR